jgi:hypothetical protein
MRIRTRALTPTLFVTLVAVAALATGTAQAQPASGADRAPQAPRGLTVGDQPNPLAIQGTPQFGWLPQDSDADEIQTAYELRVNSADGSAVWDSGKVTSADQSWVPYAGPALQPGTAYQWSVRTWDRGGLASPYASARFDTGLGDQDWSGAQWIRRTTSGNDAANDYTLARKTMQVSGDSPVVRARAYVASMGDWALHVDGRVVDKTSSRGYPGEGYYDTTDLTPFAQAGAPLTIGVEYHYQTCRCQGRANGPLPPEGPSAVLVKVVVEHADGSQDVTVSDGSWKVTQDAAEQVSTLTYRNSDAGDRVEYVGARKALTGWDTTGYDDSSWSAPAVIGPHPRPAAATCTGYEGNSSPCTFTHLVAEQAHVVTDVVHPVHVLNLPDGTVFADFGKVYSSVPAIRLSDGVAGRQLTITTSYREHNTTSAAAVAAGADRVPLASVTNLHVGDEITVDAPADGYGAGDPETRTVAAIDGSTAVLDAALQDAHATGVWVENSRAGTSNLDTQSSNMRFFYTEADGAQTAEPFTYWAWRYVEISNAGQPLTADDISAVTQTTNVPAGHEATFASSNPMLDRVFALMQRSALLTAQDTFLDTPTREKGQFLGDTEDESLATMAAFQERLLTREAIVDFAESQDRYWPNGAMNAVYPNGDAKRDIPDYTEMFPEWVMAYYQQTGDSALLARVYPAMKRVADYIQAAVDSTGLVYELPGGSGPYQYGIIDWPAPMRYDTVRDGNGAETVVNALAVGANRAVAAAAAAFGAGADSATYGQRADALTAAMNQHLYNDDTGLYSDGLAVDTRARIENYSQHAQSYAVTYGVAPESDYGTLGTRIAGEGMKQGPMDLRQLETALATTGQDDALVKLLTDPTQDGPAKILAEGGTSMWEQWDPGCGTVAPCSGGQVDQRANDSFSHGWGTAGIVEILQALLGVTVTAPGGAQVRIEPPGGGLSHAAGAVWTERGPVHVSWTRTRVGTTVDVGIPVNVSAVVVVAGRQYRIGSGHTHLFVGN